MYVSFILIGFGVLLLSVCVIVSFFMAVYYFIKKAVKNGFLEALEEYKSTSYCEE